MGRKETGRHIARKWQGWDLTSAAVAAQYSKVTESASHALYTASSTVGVNCNGKFKGCPK